MADNDIKTTEGTGVSRRQFLVGVGGVGAGALVGGFVVKGLFLPDKVFAVPAAEGYLLVDTKKCAGCASCMLACSLVHNGVGDIALSRIQVQNNVFGGFGSVDSIVQEQCRQCPHPYCAEACPTGAMHADPDNGYTRTVDQAKCIGCERCIEACPFTPSRVQWDPKKRKAQKCDLCKDTPYMTQEGGVGGQQACVAVCPTDAITFTTEIPVQSDNGYRVNLRGTNTAWALLGLPTNDDGSYAPASGAAPAPTGH
ncbi:MAG: 4Fe-4S dicluster domain-containing protein [Coriobacteriia bacterium]|nr:4Fe-4S dicluster domain-containing protein [Coriobacteriia bacterium]